MPKSFQQFLSEQDVSIGFNGSGVSIINGFEYNIKNKTLIVSFIGIKGLNGKEYQIFYNIHLKTVLNFLNADSKGRFYKEKIITNYKKCEKNDSSDWFEKYSNYYSLKKLKERYDSEVI